jgi:endonuclease/exonuclease/phosphatase family metal-dependent hydrolase
VLLVILGTRFDGPLPVVGLVFAQFCISLMWWWLTRPQAKQEMNLTGLWMLVAALAFGVLVVFDLFTFEYAFVRDFSSSLDFLNDIVPPLLRGFRGLGIAVIILAVFLSALPMVQSRRRIPWSGGGTKETFFSIIAIAGCGLLGAYYASPPVIRATVDPTQLRIASFNIHGGYNEFFDYNLSGVAGNIGVSGADLVLLQEVEAGRLTSFGIDQPLWLARETGMDVRFYGPNEDLQGLAVLSRMAFAFSEGTPLESVSTQTGLQFVQVLPDPSDTGRPINVFNTWLGPLLATDSERTVIEQQVDQHEQLREIFDVLAGLASGEGLLRSRTVLGGTFNNVPDSPLIGTIRGLGGSVAIFEDPFAGMAMEASATYIRSDIRSRLDYMWLTSGLPVYGVGVDDSPISDHRLIFVEVELP